MELNLKFNLLQQNKIKEAYFTYFGCQKNQITGKCFPTNRKYTQLFSCTNVTSDFQNFRLFRGTSTSLLIINSSYGTTILLRHEFLIEVSRVGKKWDYSLKFFTKFCMYVHFLRAFSIFQILKGSLTSKKVKKHCFKG